MRILADENIPLIDEFFADLGTIERRPGRQLCRDDLLHTDVLLVRSVTRVDQSLLEGTPVKFVATATIGTDHIDTDYLTANNIGFASSPGCNAQAVVDYVLSALSVLTDTRGQTFTDLSVGIVGVGNVGGLLRQRLETMGVTVMAVDPFKQPEDVGELVSLQQALQADVVTLHTPLTLDGPHPTHHLIGAEQLAAMRPDACLINTCRGGVVDGQALKAHLNDHGDFEAVLDVWEHEPYLDLALMQRALIATPHIAGYSLDGKMRGTEMIYHAVSEFLGLPVRCKLAQFLPEPGIKRVNFSDNIPVHQALRTAIRASYEIRVDDGVMRAAMRRSEDQRATFDQLRRDYPLRRDIPVLKVGVPARCLDLGKALEAAGFDVRVK
ncbi:4-phosphoerythronate dehydrogenase [Bacterioplanes sanyensis]|uniref:Erythronate-4-phosphate dehydrogenase n=1 Tax=Bacterioplanes sanyensis TaxID=1249553 RepID=A0A222FKK6_9GAMM|nr:4-phosphoerythronate dehydrogenase PdxB [Bacterioplanes sanyensis]ASP39577.1 4-phosphoerythronate dehydrogenase [Bacterioplanes sanyensis]